MNLNEAITKAIVNARNGNKLAATNWALAALEIADGTGLAYAVTLDLIEGINADDQTRINAAEQFINNDWT